MERVTQVRPKAIIVGLIRDRTREAEALEDLEELRRLVEDAGADVAAVVTQVRRTPDPGFYLGRGKVRELAERVSALGAELVVCDDSLRPVQVKNLEDALNVKILDRIQLILDIFARRARTREGQLQVELAQLRYLLPRLTGRGVELSRLGGGIGTRGPGETLLEMKHRQIRARIARIQRELEAIETHRRALQAERQEKGLPVFALVGYTNAGKTTLFNRLTQADAPAQDQLFTTLDPLVRKVRLGDLGEVLVSDTVGFIRKLPPSLVAAFRATLDEVYSAFALIHVIDITSPRMETEVQTVRAVLRQMRVDDKPILWVWNKIDRLTDHLRIHEARAMCPEAIFLSARTGEGLDRLIEAMARTLRSYWQRVRFRIPYARVRDLQWFYKAGRILVREDREDGVYLEAEVPPWLVGRMKMYQLELSPAVSTKTAEVAASSTS
jgi:GTP-binding protein HflX